jgi:uncharacterized protein
MNLRFALLLPFLASIFMIATASHASETQTLAFQHITIAGTELRPIHSNETGRDYLLYISYPDSYSKSPEKTFPVVYATDGYWDFYVLNAIRRGLVNDGATPEFIIVGVGYADTSLDYIKERCYELTPESGRGEYVDDIGRRHGGSQKFLRAFKNEIIPYVEGNTRADKSFRVLAGHSLGGMFALFSMYEEPGLFKGFIATSPAVICEEQWIFGHEKELRDKAATSGGLSLRARLFMSCGDREWPDFRDCIMRFDRTVVDGGYKDFEYQFRVIDGEAHDGNTAEAYNRGLRFVFASQQPVK